jgi:hypothetical protein
MTQENETVKRNEVLMQSTEGDRGSVKQSVCTKYQIRLWARPTRQTMTHRRTRMNKTDWAAFAWLEIFVWGQQLQLKPKLNLCPMINQIASEPTREIHDQRRRKFAYWSGGAQRFCRRKVHVWLRTKARIRQTFEKVRLQSQPSGTSC